MKQAPNKITMYPDYANDILWDEEGVSLGDYDVLYLHVGHDTLEIDLSHIVGLKEWFLDWDRETLYYPSHWTDAQWKEWWSRGLELARKVKTILPDDVELYYFTLKDPIWKVRPEDTDDGGVFNEGVPIRVD